MQKVILIFVLLAVLAVSTLARPAEQQQQQNNNVSCKLRQLKTRISNSIKFLTLDYISSFIWFTVQRGNCRWVIAKHSQKTTKSSETSIRRRFWTLWVRKLQSELSLQNYQMKYYHLTTFDNNNDFRSVMTYGTKF
jgi:hypothetical protein